ncbi:MAG: VOC family protein [Gemmatimonadota bacterium]|nr:VOC family protein [Gemmatimonadota bacterium]
MRIVRSVVAAAVTASIACGSSSRDETSASSESVSETAGRTEAAPVTGTPGITANNAFFYYADVEGAARFYTETLGLRKVADYGFAKILQIAETSFLTLVDAERGMHSADEPKTVALALITDQLDEWWDYVSGREIPLRSTGYSPDPTTAHDGFVAIDPEGYLLEFERFNEHEENARFVPLLDAAPTLPVGGDAGEAPGDLGFKATVIWTYYRDIPAMQRFYEDRFGLDMIVDQGLAKIYPTSATGYLGLVDETRGMHRFTEDKAVTLSFLTDDLDRWFERARDGAFELRSEAIETGNPRYRAFVGYDPEGYFIEFDTFLEHPDNDDLMAALGR